MSLVLVPTRSGLRTFTASGEDVSELPGRKIGALVSVAGASCVAVIDEREIWRRGTSGDWCQAAIVDLAVQSLTATKETIYVGGSDEAAIVRISPEGLSERLDGFDHAPGREEWFGNGPPLGVRSLTATSDGATILAGVHVGGVPRSVDRGETWSPTMPVLFDVHEIRAHPSRPNLVAAAAAVGLCISDDHGQTWTVFSEGIENTTCLAVAVLENEVLVSVQDGPFAKRSQVWKWEIGGQQIERVQDGLPEWLEGRVDTGGLAAGCGRAAIADGGGNLWLSTAGSAGWQKIADGLPYVFGLAIVEDY
jgi:hypothetical protein